MWAPFNHLDMRNELKKEEEKGKELLEKISFMVKEKGVEETIKALHEEKVVDMNDAKEVGRFLFEHSDGFGNKLLGEYLSEMQNLETMVAFIKSIDYKGRDPIICLKDYISRASLPGEASKIDRIIENIGVACYESNCKTMRFPFDSSDKVYLILFAIVMLNTDLHNSVVVSKITKKMFIRQCDFGNEKIVGYQIQLFPVYFQTQISLIA